MAALGEDPRVSALSGLRFAVADLPGAELGGAQGGTIALDADAAGHGWFVDATPHDSGEFALRTDDDTLSAAPGSAAFGAIDLLTAVRHEIGHALGFDHDDGLAVMREELATGVRYGIDLDATAPQPVPAAPGAASLAFELFDPYHGAGTNAGVDWRAGANDGWGAQLSPYEPAKPKASNTPNFAGFTLKLPEKSGFDSLGRALLGRN
jgi:hypothetical protein